MMIRDLSPRVLELGKIKIGGKGEEVMSRRNVAFRPPVKHDHFTITTLQRDQNGDLVPDDELMATLAQQQGVNLDQITEIPIALLSDDIEDVMQSAYVYYVGKHRIAQSDGGDMVTWYGDPRTNPPTMFDKPREGPNVERYVQTKMLGEGDRAVRMFKPHGIFSCVIAAGESRFGGVYRFRTTSIITIEQIYSGLAHIKELTRGSLRGVPLRLVIRPLQVAPKGIATVVYVVHVEMRGQDLTAIQQQVLAARQLELQTSKGLLDIHRQYKALLRAPGAADESDDEQAEAQSEFHGETAVPGEVVDLKTGEVTPAAPADAPAPPAPAPVAVQAPAPKTRGRKAAEKPAEAPPAQPPAQAQPPAAAKSEQTADKPVVGKLDNMPNLHAQARAAQAQEEPPPYDDKDAPPPAPEPPKPVPAPVASAPAKAATLTLPAEVAREAAAASVAPPAPAVVPASPPAKVPEVLPPEKPAPAPVSPAAAPPAPVVHGNGSHSPAAEKLADRLRSAQNRQEKKKVLQEVSVALVSKEISSADKVWIYSIYNGEAK